MQQQKKKSSKVKKAYHLNNGAGVMS